MEMDVVRGTTVLGPFQEMWGRMLDYLPNLAAGFLIVMLGLVVCWFVKAVVVRVMLLVRIDRPLRNFRWGRALHQADVRHSLAVAIGNVTAAIVFLIFLDNAVIVWRLQVLAELIGALVFYLPRLLVGAVVLVIGGLIAASVAGRVRSGLASEGFAKAGLAGKLTQWALMIVVAAFTLEELGIAPRTLQTAVLVGLGSLGLAVVIAVGLGSREAVARVWNALLREPADT